MYSQIKISSFITFVVFTLLINLFATIHCAERVNCRRVVFHPYCRGISAKRSSLQLKEAQEFQPQPSLEELRDSLPKIWQGLLFPEVKHRIVDQFNSQQTIPRPMTALILDGNRAEKDRELEREEYVFVGENNMADKGQMIDESQFHQPPYMLDIVGPTTKRQSRFNHENDKELMERNFHAKIVSLPEFMKIFDSTLMFVLWNDSIRPYFCGTIMSITVEYLENKLRDKLSATHVQIEDVSDGCGAKFIATIVSSKFEGLPLLQQHRLVNEAIGEDMNSIHSFRMKTMTPEKFASASAAQT